MAEPNMISSGMISTDMLAENQRRHGTLSLCIDRDPVQALVMFLDKGLYPCLSLSFSINLCLSHIHCEYLVVYKLPGVLSCIIVYWR